MERGEKKRAASPQEEVPEEEVTEEQNLREELAGIDVNLLTPMQALALISEWKEKYR